MSRIRNIALALPLALAAPALAADRQVPSPVYPSIAAAVAAAQPGDRIVVAPGVYREHVVSTVVGLTFVGRHAVWDATLDTGAQGVCLTASGGGTVVQGFRFVAGDQAAACLDLTGDDCRVTKCELLGTDSRLADIAGLRARVTSCRLVGTRTDAIDITGDDAIVDKIVASHVNGAVVHVTGARARITRGRFELGDGGAALVVDGDAAFVAAHRFGVVRRAVIVNGNGAVVEELRCTGGGDIMVTGDAATIRRNSFVDGVNRVSIRLDSATVVGGGLIEDNSMLRIPNTAMDLRCANVTVRRNRISLCGAGGDAGILVNDAAVANQLSANSVSGCDGHAYEILGTNNVFTDCVATGATADGFHVENDGNTLTDCRATACGGEGLDNGADGTVVTGCTFRDNRLDVANDGTFANFGTDNVFKTGGTSTLPQVD